MKQIEVAIGVVIGEKGVLICQRPATGKFAGLWEFPGGKIEPGESPASCAKRELKEELNIEVDITQILETIQHDYGDFAVVIHPLLCRQISGEPRAIACQQFRWIPAAQLCDYSFPEANRPLLDKLIIMKLNREPTK